MKGKEKILNIALAALSGPVLAALILLVPLGVLTGLSVALDPSLAMFEFVPEEELLVPFIMLAIFISAANTRLAIIMSRDEKSGRIFRVTTDRYADDRSGEQNIHGHPGRAFALEFRDYLATREDQTVSLGEPIGEDYGWGFWVGEKEFSPLWVAIAHDGQKREDARLQDYILAVTLEPPLTPWRRLTYKPDFALRDEIESRLTDFLTSKNIAFTTEAEDWVDPEPKSYPAPRF
jgi:hypothetical protein